MVTAVEAPAAWTGIACTVRGATHRRAGLENQDRALLWTAGAGPLRAFTSGLPVACAAAPPLVAAVSDGHGSPRHFRSALGAAFAAESLAESARAFVETPSDEPVEAAAGRLAADVVRRWLAKVEADYAERRPDEAERARRDAHAPPCDWEALDRNPAPAYGATLVAVLVTGTHVVYLQLGDGDLLAVSASGEVDAPLSRAEPMAGEATLSLCTPRAWQHIRTRVCPLDEAAPALLMLSTDGYEKAFRDYEAFLKSGFDYLCLLQRDGGPDLVCAHLPAWLQEITDDGGAGDDTTACLLARTAALRPAAPPRFTLSEAARALVAADQPGARRARPQPEPQPKTPPDTQPDPQPDPLPTYQPRQP